MSPELWSVLQEITTADLLVVSRQVIAGAGVFGSHFLYLWIHGGVLFFGVAKLVDFAGVSMTIEWILGLVRPTSAIVNSNVGVSQITNNNNRFQPDFSMVGGGGGGAGSGPGSGGDIKIGDFRPILTNQYHPDSPSQSSNLDFNNNEAFFRDGYQSDLKMPVFTPGYPAFFLLILLVSLTTFALFLLVFLCCLDAEDVGSIKNARLLGIPGPSPEPEPEPEPEPPFKDVGTETEDPIPDPAAEDEGDESTESEVTELTEIGDAAEESAEVKVAIEEDPPAGTS